MEWVGQVSSTVRSGAGEYAPTEDEETTAPAPAGAAASNTRALPTAFTRQVSSGSWLGWKSQARWTTVSAPASTGSRSSVATSAATNRTDGGQSTAGARRATATTSVTSGRRASSSTTLVPTLPVAPTTTMRTGRSYPRSEDRR